MQIIYQRDSFRGVRPYFVRVCVCVWGGGGGGARGGRK